MTTRLSRLAVAAVVAGATGVTSVPAKGQVVDLRTQVRHWLEVTCGVGESSTQPTAVTALGTDAVTLFIEEFESGPPSHRVNELRAAASRRHERIETLLRDGQTFGLSESNLAILRQTTRDDYVRQAVRDVALSWGNAALRAVSIIGGEEGRAFLERVALDPASDHNETAAQLLRGR